MRGAGPGAQGRFPHGSRALATSPSADAPALFQRFDRGDPVGGFGMGHQPCRRAAAPIAARQMGQLVEQRLLRRRADAGAVEQGGGIGVRLIFVLPAQPRGQQRGQRPRRGGSAPRPGGCALFSASSFSLICCSTLNSASSFSFFAASALFFSSSFLSFSAFFLS